MIGPMLELQRRFAEGAAICSCRIMFGDSVAAEMAMEQDLTIEEMAEMLENHPKQFRALQKAYFENRKT